MPTLTPEQRLARIHLFVGYYYEGNDYVGSFDTVEDAREAREGRGDFAGYWIINEDGDLEWTSL